MIKEIEKKYRITEEKKAQFVKNLLAVGGIERRSKHERDTYFNVAGRDSLTSKECLRVRETDSLTEITYKPPTQASAAKQLHFAKKETSVTVPSAQAAIDLLTLIGNTILVVVDKSRIYYMLDDCTVSVDTIKGTGIFVEIEVETADELAGVAKIDTVAHRLGLDESMIETSPYRDVVLRSTGN